LSARGAASLVEIDRSLSTWPQLASEVALGATAVAEAVRRIGLREELRSGRVRIDIAEALDHLAEPAEPSGAIAPAAPAAAGQPTQNGAVPGGLAGAAGVIVAAALRAPSGGNTQPWRIDADEDLVTIELAPEHTSTMDVGYRGSAVAVGAAVFNARVAAAAHRVLGPVQFSEGADSSPLRATVRLARGDDADLGQLYRSMLSRETNRHHGSPGPIAAEIVESLDSAVHREGARLRLLTARAEIDEAAGILAAADRTRYLTPRLHAEMISELRWPGDESPDSGIDVRSLELPPGEFAALDLLRRPEVMAHLVDWGAGSALGEDTQRRVRACSALGVVSVHGHTLTDYARGGSAAEAAWIAAQRHGLAVQPVSPVFLYSHTHGDLRELSPRFAAALLRLQNDFRDLTATGADEYQVLVLTFSHAPRASVRSRRSLDRVRQPTG
jgi:hypothetical protein